MIRQGQTGTKNLSKTLHFVCITRNTTFYILNEVPSLEFSMVSREGLEPSTSGL